MEITYVSHASLLIEAGGASVVTDPWYDGPAYARQWNLFPKPADVSAAQAADFVLISHGHEDHLHEATLRRMASGKTALYPFYWYAGTVEYLAGMGFDRVVELKSGKAFSLARDLSVTFIVNGQDSIIVIEHEGKTLANVNDALHSSESFLIDLYIGHLKKRWPKIDYVFCGFGGASYYPNIVHGPGKEDKSVAQLREQLFIHNFCHVVHGLRPRIAVPFAADFVLLAPHQRWINAVRFPRESIPDYYAAFFGGDVKILPMYPGDRLQDDDLRPTSPYRRAIQNGGTSALLPEQYPEEISAFVPSASLPEDDARLLSRRLRDHVTGQLPYYDPKRTAGLKFSLVLNDVKEKNAFNVTVAGDGSTAEVQRAASPPADAIATVDTVSQVVRASMDSDWGGDAIIIGYGAEVRVRTREAMQQGVGRLVAELLVRHPQPLHYALRHPIRALRYGLQTRFATKARLSRKIRAMTGRTGDRESSLISGTHWLTCDAERLRQICGLPRFGAVEAEAEHPLPGLPLSR